MDTVLVSAAGTTEIDLAGLGHEPERFDYGRLDMELVVQRYPERVEALELTLETVDQPSGRAGCLFRQGYSVRWADGLVESGVCFGLRGLSGKGFCGVLFKALVRANSRNALR